MKYLLLIGAIYYSAFSFGQDAEEIRIDTLIYQSGVCERLSSFLFEDSVKEIIFVDHWHNSSEGGQLTPLDSDGIESFKKEDCLEFDRFYVGSKFIVKYKYSLAVDEYGEHYYDEFGELSGELSPKILNISHLVEFDNVERKSIGIYGENIGIYSQNYIATSLDLDSIETTTLIYKSAEFKVYCHAHFETEDGKKISFTYPDLGKYFDAESKCGMKAEFVNKKFKVCFGPGEISMYIMDLGDTDIFTNIISTIELIE
jgi:hypothetical protein